MRRRRDTSARWVGMRGRLKLGVRGRIVIPFGLICLLLAIVGGWWIHSNQAEQSRRLIADRAAAIGRAVTHLAETTDDEVLLQRFVAAMATEPDVSRLFVASGRPLTIVAASQSDWLGMQATQTVSPNAERDAWRGELKLLMRAAGFQHGDHQLVSFALPIRSRIRAASPLIRARGAVLLQLDAGPTLAAEARRSWSMLLAFLGLIGLLAMGAFGVLSAVVLRPIEQIMLVARRIAAGDRERRIRNTSSDELGELARNVDGMIDQLVRREAVELDAKEEALEAQRQMEAALAELACSKFALDQHAIVAITDLDGTIQYVNDKFSQTSQFSREELIGQSHRLVQSGYHTSAFWGAMWKTVLGGRVWHGEICNRAKDGSEYWVDTTMVPYKNTAGAITQLVAICTDVTERKEYEQQLARDALHDQLTGLPNRACVLQRLQTAIERLHADDMSYALLFLDFDRFKLINDSLGHDAGDELLRQIAGRLRGIVGDDEAPAQRTHRDIAARLGGDEFVVLVQTRADEQYVLEVASRLLAVFADPYTVGQQEVHSSASIGIVFGQREYTAAEEVLRDADTAMYEAKRRGKAQYAVFDSSMRQRVRRRHQLECDLFHALREDEIRLRYEPMIDIATGTTDAFEMHLTWQHPLYGSVGSDEFIPIAEESGLAADLAQWLIESAFQQLAQWQSETQRSLPRLHVNLSAAQFALPALADLIRNGAARFEVDTAYLQLEVSEGAFASDLATIIGQAKRLRETGARIALDHFGIGTSSFTALHRLPIDTLKIDRSLLADLRYSDEAAALIHGLAVIVRNMGISLVALGIDDSEQLIALQGLGCAFAQGRYFAGPMEPKEATAFLHDATLQRYTTRGTHKFQRLVALGEASTGR